MTHVAVIGAGLQGATVALELARRGADVTVFEAAPEAVSRASRWNEGKLHLGYIFAKDAINRTARLLIDGATRFAPVLERHIPASSIEGNLSAGFHYLVMPDSLLDHAALGHHYAAVTSLANEALSDPARRYPGGRQTLAVRPLTASENARYGNGATGYLTDEIAVDAVAIAEALCGAMDACPRVDLVTNARVQAVERAADALFLDVNGSREGPFDHVVNASWEGRLALDATLGIHPSRGHVWRLKRAVQIRRPDAMTRLPTVTMVIGPYGDIVPYPDGRTYLSWYPVGCISRSSERAVPGAWEAPHSEAETARLTRDMIAALEAIVPGVAEIAAEGPTALEGGIIFTWGDPERDVDDPESELHERYDVGVATHDARYHSIDTGKYTLAPHFADIVAERIMPS